MDLKTSRAQGNDGSVERVSHSVMSDSLRPHGLQPTRLLCPWDFPGKNTGVGCHFLLQEVFLTQEMMTNILKHPFKGTAEAA